MSTGQDPSSPAPLEADAPIGTPHDGLEHGRVVAGTAATGAAWASRASGIVPRGTTRVFVIGFVELAAIIIVWRLTNWNLPLLLAVHAAAIAALGLNLRDCRQHGEDTSLALLGLIASFAVGPAGAIGAGCLDVLVRLNSSEGRLLADWYERISLATAVDPVTRHCDDVSAGRAMNLTAGVPASFLAAIESGTLADRQAVLGIVARRFHADYLPVLQAALKSTEPVIRVQAAAVAAHVRPDISRLFKATLDAVPAAGADPAKALQLLQHMDAMTASGLLDERDRLRGLAVAASLGDRILADLGTRTTASRDVAGTGDALERLLLARGRFAQLRTHRSARRTLRSRPRARIRRLGTAAADLSGAVAPSEMRA